MESTMRWVFVVFFSLVAVVASSDAPATTWRVEKGGSGDYAEIQDAIDAAASGDTIRIGPGRFEDFRPYTFPGGDYLIVAYVPVDNLTIIGSGPEQTIIGPSTVGEPYPDPQTTGVMYSPATANGVLLVENSRIENLLFGIYGVNIGARIAVYNCEFNGGTYGIFSEMSLRADGSEFSSHFDRSVLAFSSADSVFIDECLFSNAGSANLQSQAAYTDVRDSEFTGGPSGEGGVYFEGGGGGVYDSSFWDMVYCVTLTSPQLPRIVGNTMSAIWSCIRSTDSEAFIAENNVLQGGDGPVIYLHARGLPHNVRNNHILKGAGLAVYLAGDYWAPDGHRIDMTRNWWGTTDTDSIAAWIHDANDPDNPSLKVYIDYEPFHQKPVPAEKTSLGGLKALFR